MGGNEDVFQQLKSDLDRVIDQILSGIPESDHVDSMCGVVELIEGHTEEVKYTLGKMCLVLTQISTGLKAIQGVPDFQEVLQQILPDRVQRLDVVEHELLQMQVQLDEVRKENVIIKRSNIQLAGNLEDTETLLVEIQLNLESSHVNDSYVSQARRTIKLDRLIVLSKSSLLGWFLHVSLIVIIKGRSPVEVSLIVIIKQV